MINHMSTQATQTYIISINNRDTFRVTAFSEIDAIRHFSAFYDMARGKGSADKVSIIARLVDVDADNVQPTTKVRGDSNATKQHFR